ncbi:hypothetical protein [Hydrogenophaga sp.]|uniref:hypothetical protein n=1 Tax=Hydrogenophaga sp. TaxID=1904254 RepID=UPI0025C63D36|nr:hypothetical protein [Hydrogenophaga sp.]
MALPLWMFTNRLSACAAPATSSAAAPNVISFFMSRIHWVNGKELMFIDTLTGIHENTQSGTFSRAESPNEFKLFEP